MPRITTTTQVIQTVDVRLRPHVQQMLKARCEEYARLNKQKKDIEARMKRIGGEAETLLIDEDQVDALVAGTSIDGHRIKLVAGSSTRLDKDKLKRTHGLTQKDLDDCSTTTPSKPYIKITAPGEKGGDDE